MFHIGRARHPGPAPRDFTPGQLSVEFINVGGWLTCGDLALDSCALFLAVAEHRLIPSRAKSVCHQLRKAGHHSVWAPACQDKIAGGHAGVGVISLDGAPLPLPSFVTPQFQEFFRLGRVLRTTLPTSQEGVVHLFVVYGYQAEDAEKLRLTDHLLQAVLVEAQVVCVGLLLSLALSLKSGLLLTFLFLLAFVLMLGWLTLLALLYVSLFGLLVGWIFSDKSSSSSSRLVQDVWDVYRDELGVVPNDVVLALRDAVSRSSVDDFWSIWSSNAEASLFRACALAGGPTHAGRSAFLGRGLLRIRSRRLGGRAVGATGSSRLYRACQNDELDKHCAQFFLSTPLSPVLLFRRRLKSVADVLKGIRSKGVTQSRWMLC